jgi:hypothetical protein
MDWAYCDICRVRSRQEREVRFIEAGPDQAGQEAGGEVEVEAQAGGQEEPEGRQRIADISYEVEEAEEDMFRAMRELQQQCIYCMLIHGKEGHGFRMTSHIYIRQLFPGRGKRVT